MTDRVRKFREESLSAVPSVSPERALIVTEFYREGAFFSPPMRRAMAFKHIMEKKEICINDGELIVGERGPAPKSTYTYPELCCHSLQDLDILNSREKVWFKVSDETRIVYADTIIPFWQGKTIREKIFEEMSEEWKAAYSAGIFTEFMEQRAPGHTVLDDKIYRKGMLDFKREIAESVRSLDSLQDPEAYSKREELRAMNVSVDAVLTLAVATPTKRMNSQTAREAQSEKQSCFRSKESVAVCRRLHRRASGKLFNTIGLFIWESSQNSIRGMHSIRADWINIFTRSTPGGWRAARWIATKRWNCLSASG